jgi:hypothetical protein
MLLNAISRGLEEAGVGQLVWSPLGVCFLDIARCILLGGAVDHGALSSVIHLHLRTSRFGC